jgi:hypothetical protein
MKVSGLWLQKNQGYTVKQALKVVKEIIDDRELTENELKFITDLAPAPALRQEDAGVP